MEAKKGAQQIAVIKGVKPMAHSIAGGPKMILTVYSAACPRGVLMLTASHMHGVLIEKVSHSGRSFRVAERAIRRGDRLCFKIVPQRLMLCAVRD